MQARRDDDLKDSFYLHIMRNSIGAGLRSQYATAGHMPDRLAALLKELNGAEDHGAAEKAAAKREEQTAGPAQKHAGKR